MSCKFEAIVYPPIHLGSGQYMVEYSAPKPWWKPQFIHNKQVIKLIEQIKEEMRNEV